MSQGNNSTVRGGAEDDAPEVMATVLSCTYRPRVGRAVAFGLPAAQHYRIAYNFWAEGELRTAEMWADKPIPQGSVFAVRPDPEAPGRRWPEEHLEGTARVRGRALLLIGVAGSVVFSLLWLLFLRGCQ